MQLRKKKAASEGEDRREKSTSVGPVGVSSPARKGRGGTNGQQPAELYKGGDLPELHRGGGKEHENRGSWERADKGRKKVYEWMI